MMNQNSYQLFGMHISSWFLVALLLVFIFAFFYKFSDSKSKKDSPLDILKRRLALGEISLDEYLEKKKVIES
jgi:putative membrane protein